MDVPVAYYDKTALSFGNVQWEFGGFPAWLLNPAIAPDLVIRTFNPTYIGYVDKWWSVLFQVVEPLLYNNGGPVIMVQIENEFGSYGDVSTNPLDKQVLQLCAGGSVAVLLFTVHLFLHWCSIWNIL